MLFADAAAAAGAAITTPLSFSIIVAQTYHSPPTTTTHLLTLVPLPSLLLVVVIDAFYSNLMPHLPVRLLFSSTKRTNQNRNQNCSNLIYNYKTFLGPFYMTFFFVFVFAVIIILARL